MVQHHIDVEGGFLTGEDLSAFVHGAGGTDADFYICGPGPFMDLVESTLQELGIEPERIFIERFLVEQRGEGRRNRGGGRRVRLDRGAAEVTVILGGKKVVVAYQPGDTILEDHAGAVACAHRSRARPATAPPAWPFQKEGSVTMRANNTLTPEEVEEGWILTCQSVPSGPTVLVEYEDM